MNEPKDDLDEFMEALNQEPDETQVTEIVQTLWINAPSNEEGIIAIKEYLYGIYGEDAIIEADVENANMVTFFIEWNKPNLLT